LAGVLATITKNLIQLLSATLLAKEHKAMIVLLLVILPQLNPSQNILSPSVLLRQILAKEPDPLLSATRLVSTPRVMIALPSATTLETQLN
jgi:hypothetical protein